MNWQQPVDIYCERLSEVFWAEPLNALTNIAFIIAAYMLFKRFRSAGIKDKRLSWLVAWVAIIGAGSFAFHTLATRGASLLDVIPITIFIVSFIGVFFHMVLDYRAKEIIAPLLLFFLLDYLFSFVPAFLQFNGTIQYAPAFIFLVCLTSIMHQKFGIHYSKPMVGAVALLMISMTMRSVDMAWCGGNPYGTHFLWHILNGGVLYLAVMALLRFRIRT